MKTSERDKVLAMILPALLIAMGYLFFYLIGDLRLIARLEEEVKKARVKVPDPDQRFALEDKLREISAQMEELKQGQNYLEQRWRNLAQPWAEESHRHYRLKQVLGLLARYRLTLLEHGPGEGQGTAARVTLSASLGRMSKQIQHHHPAKAAPQLWRIHLAGSYASMQEALRGLADSEPLALPVSLSLEETKTGTPRQWTLWIWI